VVAAALKRPKENRIKPVCRLYPHVTPVGNIKIRTLLIVASSSYTLLSITSCDDYRGLPHTPRAMAMWTCAGAITKVDPQQA